MIPAEFFIPEFTKPVRLSDNSETTGIFDNQAKQAFYMTATAPQIALLAADADKVSEKDSIWIADVEYIAKNREHDDEGIVILYLKTV